MWPRDLTVLVPEYLKEVSQDPFDGRPLRYRRTAEGVVVYSVGEDRIDDGGRLNRATKPVEGTDIGFQLWDPGHRR